MAKCSTFEHLCRRDDTYSTSTQIGEKFLTCQATLSAKTSDGPAVPQRPLLPARLQPPRPPLRRGRRPPPGGEGGVGGGCGGLVLPRRGPVLVVGAERKARTILEKFFLTMVIGAQVGGLNPPPTHPQPSESIVVTYELYLLDPTPSPPP